eukprot:c32783_g1_i1.p1 GENE.c32783_g1_i1~~c32783_g1_i1.p1  ORF type:complete len:711 (+),score=158.43 c32783_g1_i1:284-2134(+)
MEVSDVGSIRAPPGVEKAMSTASGGASGPKKGMTLSEHRLAKEREKAANAQSPPTLPDISPMPSLPGLGSTSNLKSISTHSMASNLGAANPSEDPLASKPGEVSVADLLAGIRDLSALNMIAYGKTHFHLDKGGLMRKPETVEKRLKWQETTLKRPLHARLGKKVVNDAVQIFPFIQAYMGDKSATDLDMIKLAQHIIQNMIKERDLRDEVFCQLCKQTTDNPKFESVMRGWQLIALVCGCVHPGPELDPYFIAFLETHKQDKSDVGKLAAFAHRRLESTKRTGDRKFVPSHGELEAVRQQKPYILRIYFLDETFKTVVLDASLSNQEVCQLVADKIRLRESSNFSLFEYNSTIETRMLRDDEQVFDVLGRWEHENRRAIKKKEIKQKEAETRFRLVFKPKLVLPTMEDVTDPACVDLLYVQSVFHVLAGNYSCTPEDAVKMAALQLQVSVGDHSAENVTKGLVADQIEKYLPKQWINTRTPAEWEKIIFELHQRLSGRDNLNSKLHYLNYVKRRPLYGASFFHVTQKNQIADVPEALVLAINHEGMQILKPGITKEKLQAYPFSEIVSWAFTAYTFTFVTGDLAQQKKFTVETTRGHEMSAVCQGYVNALLEAGI